MGVTGGFGSSLLSMCADDCPPWASGSGSGSKAYPGQQSSVSLPLGLWRSWLMMDRWIIIINGSETGAEGRVVEVVGGEEMGDGTGGAVFLVAGWVGYLLLALALALGDCHVVWLAGCLCGRQAIVLLVACWLGLIFPRVAGQQRDGIGDRRLTMVCCLAHCECRP